MFRSISSYVRSSLRRNSLSKRKFRPSFDRLEDRLAPAVFNVNTTADLSIAGGVNPDGTIIGQGSTITLRSAIQAANANSGVGGNTINLTRSGTYQITQLGTAGETDNVAGEFSIFPTAPNGNLSIINTSGGLVFVDGGGNNRVFDINASDTTDPATQFLVTMQGFTIQNGIASPGDLAPGGGGGIRDQGNQSLTLTKMVVTNNSATGDGGGIDFENTVNSSWTLTINNSTISNNHAGDAGGGIDTDGAGTVVINSGSVISGNTDVNQGAGIYIDAILVGAVFVGASMDMTGTIVSNNSALASGTVGPPASGGSGGGISNAGNGAMTIANSTISNNFAGGSGGGFSDENAQGTLTISNSYFLNNVAIGDGGAIQEGGPSTSITNTEIKGNVSGGSGGGLFATGTTVTITATTFANNTATGGGGGIELQTTGTIGGGTGSSITTTTITNNRALNNAGTNGGGIDASTNFTGDLTLLNDTINANFADNGGGIFWAGNGTFSLRNTIVAKNAASTTGPDANNPAGTFTDNGGNLIGVSGAGSGNTGFGAGTTQMGTVASPLNPLLGALANNGGPTVGAAHSAIVLETEALLIGSPAFGKGVLAGAPFTDERGFPSVVNGKINVGAVSNTPSVAPPGNGKGTASQITTQVINGVLTTIYNVNTLADTLTPPPGFLSLRLAIQDANNATDSAIINLTVVGDYQITRVGTPGETDNIAGELAIIPNAGRTSATTLTIQNMSTGAVTVDGNLLNRVFDINPGNAFMTTSFTVIMKGFTITNGIASAGDGPDATGGGIRDQNNANLTLTNMTITNDSATADGGGIVMENTVNSSWTLIINNSTISNDHAGDAGGGIDTDGAGTIVINKGTVISGNTDVNQGAGIYVDSILVGAVFISAPTNMTGTIVSNDAALAAGTLGPPASGGSGGGISNAGNSVITIAGSTVSNNYAGGAGGGFSDENGQGTLNVSNSFFLNNVSVIDGGGIQAGGPSTSITNTEFKGNSTAGSGAAVFANGTTLTVAASTFANNTAEIGGGAIELQTTGTIGVGTGSTITNATITNNRALFNAGANGGGIDASANFTGDVTLLNDTINANFADNGGGIFWAGNGTFGLQNTIVAKNTASTTGPDANNPAGTFTDNGGNLIGVSGAGSGNTGFIALTTQTGTVAAPLDPKLGPLANNRGPTVGAFGASITLETEALLTLSPAIDTGVAAGAPNVDARGFPRPDSAGSRPDIGAFETSPS